MAFENFVLYRQQLTANRPVDIIEKVPNIRELKMAAVSYRTFLIGVIGGD